MNLTDHFTTNFTLAEMQHSETASRNGLDNTMPDDLMPNALIVCQHLEIIRANYKLPINVLSCYRSLEVNTLCKGSKTSAHKAAFAADIVIYGIPNIQLCKDIAHILDDYDQIIYEFGPTGWCHVGFSNGPPRKMLLSAVKENGTTVYKTGIVEG